MRWAALPRSACWRWFPVLPARQAFGTAWILGSANRFERIVFHGHGPRSTSYYCYPRNYWWFYRPYTTANDGNARCMPYFHYPPARSRSGEMK